MKIAGRAVIGAIAMILAMGAAVSSPAVEGTVIDAVTGVGVPDVTVTAPGQTAVGDRNGRFQIDTGAPRIGIRAPGYWALRAPLAQNPIRLTPVQPHALYLTVHGIGSSALRESALKLIRSGKANALVIDIKGDGGLVDYPSKVRLAAGARALTTIPDLAGLVKSLHAEEIYAIARIVVFKDDPLASEHPEWAVMSGDDLFRDREGLAWTDPFRRSVWTYNIDIAKEAAEAGFDEVQFDYIRFPDSPQALRFAQPADQTSRVEAIAGFLTRARDELAPYNVFLSADFFGYVCWNSTDTGIGQELTAIAGAVDYLSPMLYPSGFHAGIPGFPDPVANSYTVIRLSLEKAGDRLGISPKRFRPWLQAFKDYAFDGRLFDAALIHEQIRATEDFGTGGWMLWNARNRYDAIGGAATAQDLAIREPALSNDGPPACH